MFKISLVLMIPAVLLLSTTPIFNYCRGACACWPLDEGRGAKIKDISENRHHGEIKGPKWTTGKIGKGLIFASKDNKELVKFRMQTT